MSNHELEIELEMDPMLERKEPIPFPSTTPSLTRTTEEVVTSSSFHHHRTVFGIWIMFIIEILTSLFPLIKMQEGWITVRRSVEGGEVGSYGWNTATETNRMAEIDPPLLPLEHPILMGMILGMSVLIACIFIIWLTKILTVDRDVSSSLKKWSHTLKPLVFALLACLILVGFAWTIQTTTFIQVIGYRWTVDDAFLFFCMTITGWLGILYMLTTTLPNLLL